MDEFVIKIIVWFKKLYLVLYWVKYFVDKNVEYLFFNELNDLVKFVYEI